MGKVDTVETLVIEKAGPAAKVVVAKVIAELGTSRADINDEQFPAFVDLVVRRAISDASSRSEVRWRIEQLFGVPSSYTYDEKACIDASRQNEFYARAHAIEARIAECEKYGIGLENTKQELKCAIYYIEQSNFTEAKRYLDSSDNFVMAALAGAERARKESQKSKPETHREGARTIKQEGKQKKLGLLSIGSYVIKSANEDSIYSCLKMHLERGIPALCISTTPPHALARAYGLEAYSKLRLVWMPPMVGDKSKSSGHDGEDVNVVQSNNLDHLVRIVESFITKHQSKGSIVIMDCFENIVKQNDFSLFLNALKKMNEHVMPCASRLVVPIARTLDEKEMMLEREMIII